MTELSVFVGALIFFSVIVLIVSGLGMNIIGGFFWLIYKAFEIVFWAFYYLFWPTKKKDRSY